MANDSLTNFLVLMNCQFWRNRFPSDNRFNLHFYNAAYGCLSTFGTVIGSMGSFIRSTGVEDGLLWAILVHRPVRPTNRSPERDALVGGELNSSNLERRYAADSTSS